MKPHTFLFLLLVSVTTLAGQTLKGNETFDFTDSVLDAAHRAVPRGWCAVLPEENVRRTVFDVVFDSAVMTPVLRMQAYKADGALERIFTPASPEKITHVRVCYAVVTSGIRADSVVDDPPFSLSFGSGGAFSREFITYQYGALTDTALDALQIEHGGTERSAHFAWPMPSNTADTAYQTVTLPLRAVFQHVYGYTPKRWILRIRCSSHKRGTLSEIKLKSLEFLEQEAR